MVFPYKVEEQAQGMGSPQINVAEYVTASAIEQEPAFACWVPYTLRKRDVIVSAVSLRIRKASHKCEI